MNLLPVSVTFTRGENSTGEYCIFEFVSVDPDSGEGVVYSGTFTEFPRYTSGPASARHKFLARVLRAASDYADLTGAPE